LPKEAVKTTASKGKTRITIRIDDDILDWFRGQVNAAGGGNYQTIQNDNEKIFSFARSLGHSTIIVVVNLSPEEQKVSVDILNTKLKLANSKLTLLFGKAVIAPPAEKMVIMVPAYGTQVWEVLP